MMGSLMAELTEQLAAEEELLSRLGITRQTVLEILDGDDHAWGALEGTDGRPGGVEVEQDGDAGAGRPAPQRGGAAVEAQAAGAARLAGRAGRRPVRPP